MSQTYKLGRLSLFILTVVFGSLISGPLQAVPPTDKPDKQEKRRQKAAQKEMESAYKSWLDEEVPYIITAEEKAAFKKLTTDDEREAFIENFWERRNPNPGSPENEFKEEYYRRIAYANEHYASGIPGWRTDRGCPSHSIPPPPRPKAERTMKTFHLPRRKASWARPRPRNCAG